MMSNMKKLFSAFTAWALITLQSCTPQVAHAQINNPTGFVPLAATVTTNANLTGPITSVGNATAIASQTGTGSKFVMDTSPVLIGPALGTPVSGVATNLTGTAAGLTAGAATTATNQSGGSISYTTASVNGTLLSSNAAPTISSGFGTSPSIASNNGSATFRVNVGTGGTASSGVIGLPTASNGWNCMVQEFAPSATALLSVTVVSASTNASVTVVNDLLSTGAATAWQASQVLVFVCAAY